ncbi:4-hydroxy-tetrahydrodipicolinate synthase [Roseovarius nanhaiticus]|uniref:4-hydroxy-tetrahydrodipicolinate synthase n=1 Tax=Roseovarius nanhaiticus TaxID=573024 RepID=A0A1N7G3Q7_9RHOB|nr:dihydrodipicolinate synthase family protein [Roseovarius nanhaiticus]SEK38127.1 4-hydroxy-tetrahydrodipicolinate synthase [Roseovarius nanhaiticus]SIS07207.1 4-hydroxy-tetrahydrodipicolinate synthase [Roseovarius nanhaiticus]
MTPIFRFDGIYTPVVTPFADDHSVRWDALADIIDWLIEQGVHGLITGGSTGENYAQTVAERIEVARFTVQHVKGRLPVIVGTGAMLTGDSIALAKAAREMGADAILLASPAYSVPTDRENALNALAIDKAADLPIMLYNYPGRTGTMMGEEFLDRVGRSRNFCGIKESSGDINRVHLLARDYPHIQLGCGMDDQALEFFAWGAPFWVCGGSNFLPAEHVALYEACVLQGDFAKGRRIMSAMMPLMRVLEQGGKFIQTIKHGVTMNGIDCEIVRPPLKGLNKDDKRALEQVTRVLKKTIADIRAEGTT